MNNCSTGGVSKVYRMHTSCPSLCPVRIHLTVLNYVLQAAANRLLRSSASAQNHVSGSGPLNVYRYYSQPTQNCSQATALVVLESDTMSQSIEFMSNASYKVRRFSTENRHTTPTMQSVSQSIRQSDCRMVTFSIRCSGGCLCSPVPHEIE